MVAALTLDKLGDVGVRVRESRAHVATPYLPQSGPMTPPYPSVLLGSYATIQTSVARVMLLGLLWLLSLPVSLFLYSLRRWWFVRLALPFKLKFPLLVVHGLGRGLEYYLGCVFS